jgi:hypothetical protein
MREVIGFAQPLPRLVLLAREKRPPIAIFAISQPAERAFSGIDSDALRDAADLSLCRDRQLMLLTESIALRGGAPQKRDTRVGQFQVFAILEQPVTGKAASHESAIDGLASLQRLPLDRQHVATALRVQCAVAQEPSQQLDNL